MSDYYQCWNHSKDQHLFEVEILSNIINVFAVTFDQINAFLLNKSINFFKKILPTIYTD